MRKLQTHLSLLREEYGKLQRRLVEVEKLYQLATASCKDGDKTDGFISRLLKVVSDLYGKELYRLVKYIKLVCCFLILILVVWLLIFSQPTTG